MEHMKTDALSLCLEVDLINNKKNESGGKERSFEFVCICLRTLRVQKD